jgi:hypothetical protein
MTTLYTSEVLFMLHSSGHLRKLTHSTTFQMLYVVYITYNRDGQISSVQNWLPPTSGSVQEQSEEQSEEQSFVVGTGAEQSSIQFWDSDEEGETSSENSGNTSLYI